MNAVFVVLSIQALLGAFDNLWHHELEAKLPQRLSARYELTLHAAREVIYAIIFIGLAWFEWHGALAIVLAWLLVIELFITLADFLEEDRTRRLPPFERVLHTVLTICYGLFLGLFAPILHQWLRLDTALVQTPRGWVSWVLTAYGIGVLAWSVRNALAVRQLQRTAKLADAAPQVAHPSSSPIKPAVLVTGATGFIGSALVAQLRREGQRLIVLSRDVRQVRASHGAGVWAVERLDDIPSETRIDAIVNLAGARVLGQPWTAQRRHELVASRVGVSTAVLDLVRRLHHRPRVLVSASAVGFYGSSATGSLANCPEHSPARPGEFQSDLCAAIEHEAQRAGALGLRVVRLRFGIVLGHGDGAYPMLALSARLGLGAVLGSGAQAAPWIHLDDAVGLIRFAMTQEHLTGPVNAVAPDIPTQRQFAQTLAASVGRRVRLQVPGALLHVMLGEMSTLLLEGQGAIPAAALSAGYVYHYPLLADAMQALAARDRGCDKTTAGSGQTQRL